jgi:hypothetical protein
MLNVAEMAGFLGFEGNGAERFAAFAVAVILGNRGYLRRAISEPVSFSPSRRRVI